MISQGQAWTREKGHGYTQVGFSTITYNSLYSGRIDNLDQIPIPREVVDQTIPIYGEYGITNKLTVSAEIPLKWVKNQDVNSDFVNLSPGSINLVPEKAELIGLGNIRLAGIYNIYKKGSWSATGKLRIDANTSRTGESGLRTGFDAWTFAPYISAGHGRRLWFAAADAGVHFRTNNFSHQFYGQVYGGINFLKNIFLFMGGLEVQQDINGGGQDQPVFPLTGLYVNNIEFVAWYFKLSAKPYKNYRIWVATGRGFGNLVARAPSFSVTLSTEF